MKLLVSPNIGSLNGTQFSQERIMTVNGIKIDKTRISGLPRQSDGLIKNLAGSHRLHHVSAARIRKFPICIAINRAHKRIGGSDGDIEVCNASFLSLAGDELENVGMVGIEDSHVCAAMPLSEHHDLGRRIKRSHEADGSRSKASSTDDVAVRTQMGKIISGPSSGLVDECRPLHCIKNGSHVIFHGKNKTIRQKPSLASRSAEITTGGNKLKGSNHLREFPLPSFLPSL